MLAIVSGCECAHTCTSLCMLCRESKDVSLSMEVNRACLPCTYFNGIALLQSSSLIGLSSGLYHSLKVEQLHTWSARRAVSFCCSPPGSAQHLSGQSHEVVLCRSGHFNELRTCQGEWLALWQVFGAVPHPERHCCRQSFLRGTAPAQRSAARRHGQSLQPPGHNVG